MYKRQAHQRYAALLEQIAADAPLPDTLDALARYVEDELPGAIASVLLLDADGAHLRTAAGPGLPAAYSAAIDGVAIGPSVGSCGTAAYERAPVMVEDIETDPRWDAYRGLARSAPYYHDGSAATLDALLAERAAVHGMAETVSLTAAQRQDLIAYLETL